MGSIFSVEYKQFLQQLNAERKHARFTQQELASKLKKPQSFVSKYERGERRLDLVEFLAISRALKIDPCVFLRKLSKSAAP